jgi:hypothetical protein
MWKNICYTWNMTIQQISKLHNVTYQTVWYLVKGIRYTKMVALAIEVSKFTGKPAINYINKNLRELYMRAYPKLKQ